jgi:hypothetical protein
MAAELSKHLASLLGMRLEGGFKSKELSQTLRGVPGERSLAQIETNKFCGECRKVFLSKWPPTIGHDQTLLGFLQAAEHECPLCFRILLELHKRNFGLVINNWQQPKFTVQWRSKFPSSSPYLIDWCVSVKEETNTSGNPLKYYGEGTILLYELQPF